MSSDTALWFGRIPDRWSWGPLGRYFTERRETVSDQLFTPLSVTKDGIVPQLDTAAKTNDGDNRKRVAKGDFVINSRSDRKGSSGLSVLDGSVSVISTVITPRASLRPEFVHHLLRSAQFQEEYYRYGTGIVADLWSTRYSQMKKIPIPVPPFEEQRRIAEFLDRETAQIDELIAKQEQLISTLAERQAEEAALLLTQGVDPVGLDQETDMWWAPRLPSHWAAVPVRYLARIRTGSGDTQDAKPEGRFPFYVRSMTVERSDRWEFEGPAVLTSGDGAGVGKVFHLARGQFSAHQRVYVMDQFRRVSPEYFYFYFSTFFGRVVLAGTAKSTVESLRRPMVGGLKVTIPSESEQAAIVQALEQRANSYDLLTRKSRAIVEILQERRQALISAAVTGQIDVGGAS